VTDAESAAGECIERVVEEIAIVQPRCIVVMGERALETLNELELPLAEELEPTLGEMQTLTPSMEALYVPDIDDSLDSEQSKRDFWAAFRALGEWYAELPPY
jgi:uracil-DNA glycosylase